MEVLVITAVKAEQKAILSGLSGDERFTVVAGGVGPVAAAISTTKELMKKKYDLIISAGIGGGFQGVAKVGTIVLATEIIAADLGAETPDGFATIEELGFGVSRVDVEYRLTDTIKNACHKKGLPVITGPILTLATVTGTQETADQLALRIPGATVEAMEGFGVALAAKEAKVPILEIRTVSNPVGPRNKEAWKIKEALLQLENVSSILREVLPKS